MRWTFICIFLWICDISCTTDVESTCDPAHLTCNNGRCISLAYKCDGDDDCLDQSDEKDCPIVTCSEMFFRCNNGHCIPERWMCDGSPDCKDESDESEICIKKCKGYQCKNASLCIDSEWKCDGQEDCPHDDDEEDCQNVCDPKTEFRCNNTKCIPSKLVCNNHEDCGDGSDEKDCEEKTECGSVGDKKCINGECINEMWWCDGDADCKDNSDELNCTSKTTEMTCNPNEFQCHLPLMDIQCIHMQWKCDGDDDCTDGSDELNCGHLTCKPDEKMCGNDTCIKETYFCDGDKDCENGEDEKNCNHTVEPSKPCPDAQFHCGGNKCVPDNVICDGSDDCGNGADEAPDRHCPLPNNNACTKNNGECNHICIPDVTEESGRRCECELGFELGNNTETMCEDINECDIPGTCSQVCTNTKGSYKCECFSGYTLTDHRYCKTTDGGHPELILSDRHDIHRYYLNTYHYSVLLQQKVSGAVAMDFDIRNRILFWANTTNKIYSARLDNNETKIILEENIHKANGLAVDWIHGNLYFSDAYLDVIQVTRLDGSSRKILVRENLEEPRALVVDPNNGWMYWTDCGTTPKIEKCGMNGQNRKAIVTEGITWPHGLTLDYVEKRLYWVDAKLHTIGSSDLDGSNVKLILKNHRNLGHPFAITVFEDFLYWTDGKSNAVHKVSKFGRGEVSNIALNLNTPMDIHVYHINRQPSSVNSCGDNNGGCSHLCLPVPKVNTGSLLSKKYECACPDNMILEGHSCKQEQTVQGTSLNKTHPEIFHGGDKGDGVVAGAVIGSLLAIGIPVILVGCLLLKRHKSKNVKSMNFDNPVYRKTTTDEHLTMEKNGSRASYPQSMQPLNQDNEYV